MKPVDFICIGSARCSTTWLHNCLSEHPEIYLPRSKELHFFDDDARYAKGMAFYESFFSDNTNKPVQGEITPRYILYRDALLRINTAFPGIRIIIILRNPVERALSQYKYFRFNKKKEPEKDFFRAIDGFFWEDYLVKSLYYRQLVDVFEIFDRDSVLILFSEEAAKTPGIELKKVYSFLGVQEDFIPSILNTRINRSLTGFNDPPPIWAKFNRLQQARPRRVNDIPVGGGISANNVLVRLVRLRIIFALTRLINRALDKSFPARSSFSFSPDDKRRIHERFFRQDVEQLEALLGKDLGDWKFPAT